MSPKTPKSALDLELEGVKERYAPIQRRIEYLKREGTELSKIVQELEAEVAALEAQYPTAVLSEQIIFTFHALQHLAEAVTTLQSIKAELAMIQQAHEDFSAQLKLDNPAVAKLMDEHKAKSVMEINRVFEQRKLE